MNLTISSLSKEYIRVAVSAKESGTAVDPTSDTVTMAFVTTDEPVSGDFKTASWETDNGKYYARCLVGPGGTITLSDGLYSVWVKVTDSPEVPVLKAGTLMVT